MYKRLFFSKKTVISAAVCILIFSIGSVITETLADRSLYNYFDIIVKFLLSAFLFHAYQRHDLLGMQAGCCGLLVDVLLHQASYVLNELFRQSMESFICLGFWGSFFLAGELTVLILETILAVNHFMVYVLRKRSFQRILVNQTTILILLFFLLLQLFINTKLMFAPAILWNFAASHLLVLAIYVLIASSELILAIDDEDGR